MLWMITVIPPVVLSTIMATIVWMRYRHQRAGQLFIAVVAVQLPLAVVSAARRAADTPSELLASSMSAWIFLALLSLTMLLFFAALYRPDAWERPQLLGWIALPYLIVVGGILLDSFLEARLFYAGVLNTGGLLQVMPGSLSRAAGMLFGISWLPHFGLLAYAFSRLPQERRSLLILIGLLLFSWANGYVMRSYPALIQFASIFNQILLIGALAYLLLRRKLFETAQVVMDQALVGMAEGIAVVGPDTTVRFTNPAIEQHLGLRQGQPIDMVQSRGFDVGALREMLGRQRLEAILETCEQAIAVTASPILGDHNQEHGYLLLSRDVTQSRAYEQTLQQRQAELLQTIEQLQATQAAQQALTETIRSLSLPIIPVADGMIVMPLIGEFDEQRVADFGGRFLRGIQDHRAHTAVLDLTGVPPIDQAAASVLVRAVNGAKLLGAQTILVGIRPEIAQSIVALGLRQNGFATAPTLQDALTTLLHRSPRSASGSRGIAISSQ
jgi:rsbT co-antagonist protein RsbR